MKLSRMIEMMINEPMTIGVRFHRKDAIAALVAKGFAERTAINHLTPSRANGALGILMKMGAIEKDGPFFYKITNPAAIITGDAQAQARRKSNMRRVRMFAGEKKAEWTSYGLVSDPEKHEVEWLLCGEKYEPKCYNLKLYADGLVPNKANYWLKCKNGRIIMNRDATILKEHHPDLFENLKNDMAEMCED